MSRAQITAICRALFAILTLVAITVQLVSLAGQGTLNPVNYFSYFTIDSNLIAVGVLLVTAAAWNRDVSPRLDIIRGGAVVYMSITGIVFTLLLSNTDVDTAIPWVNTVVHELMPLVMVADWLVTPPAARLTLRQGVLWLSFPLLWIVSTPSSEGRSSITTRIHSSTLRMGATRASPSTAWSSSSQCWS